MTGEGQSGGPGLRPLTPAEIADEAICLFLEYRDEYGYDPTTHKARRHRANGPPHGTEGVTSMQAKRTVTLYIANRVDGATEVDPMVLAAEFIQAALEGYELVQRASLEYAYRWWLATTPGRNSSWDESDWDTMADALAAKLAEAPDVRDQLWERVVP